jgi:guanylate kinase
MMRVKLLLILQNMLSHNRFVFNSCKHYKDKKSFNFTSKFENLFYPKQVFPYNNNTSFSIITKIALNKIIIITAPSGSGKTTIVKQLLQRSAKLAFSISACTRMPRPGEVDGKDYYFLTEAAFKNKIEEDAFIEWEMVYTGKYYGTLKTEVNRIWDNEQAPLVDIDVIGALNIKKQYGEKSISIFIKAPSVEELRNRLEARGTESPQTLQERLDKAAYELSFAEQFDTIIVNDNLDRAIEETLQVIDAFIRQ